MGPGTFHDARILMVDDQEVNLALLDDLLGQAGYTNLKWITDPRATLATLTAFQPDLILLDLLMPHLDGFAVMAQLRPQIADGSFLPILVLTADITPEAKRRALAGGATDFLTKPFDATEVLLRVNNLLQTRALHRQLEAHNRLLEERVRERTAEVEEARVQILALYRELAKRNQHLHELVDRLLLAQEEERRRVASEVGDEQAGPGVERLTPREQEVLRLLAQGQTNKEMARDLTVSLATVKSHVEHIIAKLGVADRTQAAVRAVELGLLSGPPAGARGAVGRG